MKYVKKISKNYEIWLTLDICNIYYYLMEVLRISVSLFQRLKGFVNEGLKIYGFAKIERIFLKIKPLAKISIIYAKIYLNKVM